MDEHLQNYCVAIAQEAIRLGFPERDCMASPSFGSRGTIDLDVFRETITGPPDELLTMMRSASSRESLREIILDRLPLIKSAYQHAARLGINVNDFNVEPPVEFEIPGTQIEIRFHGYSAVGRRREILMALQDATSWENLRQISSERCLIR